MEFRGENVRGLHACIYLLCRPSLQSQRKLSLIGTKQRNLQKFSLSKFPAIRYSLSSPLIISLSLSLSSPLPPSAESAAEILGEVGGVQDILAAMRSFPNNLEVVSNGCTALWSLSVIGQSRNLVYYSTIFMTVYVITISYVA